MKTILLMGLLMWPVLAFCQPSIPKELGTEENRATLSDRPVDYVSEDGEYRVVFPPGCGKIVSKVPDWDSLDSEGNPVAVTYISYCDRYDEKGEGCSVTTFFNLTDGQGGPPGPTQVVERIERMLQGMGVSIIRQQPVKRSLEDGTLVEGVDVLAGEKSGAGEAWLRGLLYNGDIYLLAAWKAEGGLARDPDFISFFQSFEPGVH